MRFLAASAVRNRGGLNFESGSEPVQDIADGRVRGRPLPIDPEGFVQPLPVDLEVGAQPTIEICAADHRKIENSNTCRSW